MIDECEGLDKIESLHGHDNNEIYGKAVKILRNTRPRRTTKSLVKQLSSLEMEIIPSLPLVASSSDCSRENPIQSLLLFANSSPPAVPFLTLQGPFLTLQDPLPLLPRHSRRPPAFFFLGYLSSSSPFYPS
ncbi:Importin subunit alpha-1a [Apostasia shenzhenica]|uniref:Importin subunit alpha-1a n=1 Tax=Apostasia shenzhenica TaxID=1088818 RepID=A0A2I0B5F2_9ASPA|nr:Importin subunit alpha-1a [Apostasia shenzhenica]